jgi:hypothetical protein
MKKIISFVLIAWVALNFINTFMPLPNELQFFSALPNEYRWLAFIGALIVGAALKYPKYLTWNGLKRLLGIGISWEGKTSECIGMSFAPHPEDPKISIFYRRGFNNSSKPLNAARAYLILPNGNQLPLTIVDYRDKAISKFVVDIGPKSIIDVNCQFEPMPNKSNFLKNYTPLIFVLEWNSGKLKLKISTKAIENTIRSMEKRSTPI